MYFTSITKVGLHILKCQNNDGPDTEFLQALNKIASDGAILGRNTILCTSPRALYLKAWCM